MKPAPGIGTALVTALVVVYGHGARRSRSGPVATGAVRVADTSVLQPSLSIVLSKAGYAATPIRNDRGVPVVRVAVGSTAVDGLLDSGAPFDFWLDSAFTPGNWPGVRLTGVHSGYWTFTNVEGWCVVLNHLQIGGSTSFETVEAKVEPRIGITPRMSVGATALMSRGALVDYATDTLYLLTPRDQARPTPASTSRLTTESVPTLRAALERAGQYRTFLALADRAGLAPLLDDMTTGGLRPAGDVPDSTAWLGLRVKAAQLSGVGTMPPNDLHLRVTRRTVDRELHGPAWRTVFVPTDAAFARLPVEILSALRAHPSRLASLLLAHVYVGAAIDTAAMRTLIRGVAHPGPTGRAFEFHVDGAQTDVDRLTSWEDGRIVARATIVDADLKAAHGVAIAHGIDRVLIQPAAPSPLAAVLARQGYVAIPLYRREDGNGYLVRATVNGVPVQLTVATGVPGGLTLDRRLAARSRLSPGCNYAVVFDSVRLGPARVETSDFSGPIQVARRQGYRPWDGIVGSALLVRYHARLDLATGVLYLRPPAATR